MNNKPSEILLGIFILILGIGCLIKGGIFGGLVLIISGLSLMSSKVFDVVFTVILDIFVTFVKILYLNRFIKIILSCCLTGSGGLLLWHIREHGGSKFIKFGIPASFIIMGLGLLAMLVSITFKKKEEETQQSSEVKEDNTNPNSNYIQTQKEKKEYEKEKQNEESDYRNNILILLAEIMNADSKQMNCELDRVKATISRYYTTEAERKEALNNFRNLLNTKHDKREVYQTINKELNYASKAELIMELLAVAYADGEFRETEKYLLQEVVDYLGINRQQYGSIYTLFMYKYNQGFYRSNDNKKENTRQNHKQTTRYLSSKEKDAYAILGVSADLSDAEIKKAYHALALEYHPDNAATLGDEAIRQATESMKQINMAWEVVKEARGMK